MNAGIGDEGYLCQVGGAVSCGACCGLYNVSDPSREALTARLARRTEAFSQVTRNDEAIDAFARRTRGFTPEEKPFAQFHHCSFLGLIGEGPGRVGCLLHPSAPGNHGVDLRYLSHYGQAACRDYFCPASRNLFRTHRIILRRATDHWHLYGLVVTELDLLQAFFAETESRIGRSPPPTTFLRIRSRHSFSGLLPGSRSIGPSADPTPRACAIFFSTTDSIPAPPSPWPRTSTARTPTPSSSGNSTRPLSTRPARRGPWRSWTKSSTDCRGRWGDAPPEGKSIPNDPAYCFSDFEGYVVNRDVILHSWTLDIPRHRDFPEMLQRENLPGSAHPVGNIDPLPPILYDTVFTGTPVLSTPDKAPWKSQTAPST